MSKRYINFLIVPEGNPKSLKFKLSFLMTRLALGIISFLLIFIVVMSIFYGKLLYEVVVGKSLKQENERLRRYNARVVELEEELREYRRFVQKVAELAGVQYQGSTKSQLAYHSEFIEMEDLSELPVVTEVGEGTSSLADSTKEPSDSLRHIPLGRPIEGWITQGFSVGVPGFGREHPGIDFAAKTGTEVKSTASGSVIYVGWDETYGNLVAIDHGNGYVTYYGHNSKNLVNVGDSVLRGDVIALSGNTGRSSAPHLHYEIRKDDIPINPENFLSRR